MEYGKELILDIHDCDPQLFTRSAISGFFKKLCEILDMEPEKITWWDDRGLPPEECETEPHLKGTSAVQFIITSNITIHTLDILKRVYLNIFSCKDFDEDHAARFAEQFFRGTVVKQTVLERT